MTEKSLVAAVAGACRQAELPNEKIDTIVTLVKSNLAVQTYVEELHDPNTGRLDAARIAEFLGVPLSKMAKALGISPQAVHQNTTAESLQTRLQPIERSITILRIVLANPSHAKMWLHSPHPQLEGATPLSRILEGKSALVRDMLENAMEGQFT